MDVAYETATLAKYQEIRGGRDAHLFPTLMANPGMRVMVQIAFEAGREWQLKHPTASIEFPDYDAPKVMLLPMVTPGNHEPIDPKHYSTVARNTHAIGAMPQLKTNSDEPTIWRGTWLNDDHETVCAETTELYDTLQDAIRGAAMRYFEATK